MTSIPQLFEESVKKYSQNVYLWEKKNDSYEQLTYSEVWELVYNFGAGLMKIGVKKGDRIAILSEGRNEWIIGELGILLNGAINVPLSVKLNEPSEILFRL
jgi:long-chain acyl-CoA synthetase